MFLRTSTSCPCPSPSTPSSSATIVVLHRFIFVYERENWENISAAYAVPLSHIIFFSWSSMFNVLHCSARCVVSRIFPQNEFSIEIKEEKKNGNTNVYASGCCCCAQSLRPWLVGISLPHYAAMTEWTVFLKPIVRFHSIFLSLFSVGLFGSEGIVMVRLFSRLPNLPHSICSIHFAI